MRPSQKRTVAFLLSAGLPFFLCFGVFLYSQRLSMLTAPDVYIDRLKHDGAASYTTSQLVWKTVLAQDPLCAEADVVVIGSSRLREVDAHVVGASVCNLHVDGLNGRQFAVLAQAVPRIAPGRPRTVYVGLDHIFFWAPTHRVEWIDLELFKTSRLLWATWRAVEPLSFFSTTDVREAIRRRRQAPRSSRLTDQETVWFPDGHVLYPRYYAAKHTGIHERIRVDDVEENVRGHFRDGHIRPEYLQGLKVGVRALRKKGYTVYLFWEPLSPDYLALARRRYPGPFGEAIAAVESMQRKLKVHRYVSAPESLDASRFDCTPDDRRDASHVDIDCMDRFFATVFHSHTPSGGMLSESLVANLTSPPGPAR